MTSVCWAGQAKATVIIVDHKIYISDVNLETNLGHIEMEVQALYFCICKDVP